MSLPVWMKLQIKKGQQKSRNIYLPLILLWIILLPLLLLALPFVLIGALLTWNQGQGKILLAMIPMLPALLFALPGLYVLIEKKNEKILLYIV